MALVSARLSEEGQIATSLALLVLLLLTRPIHNIQIIRLLFLFAAGFIALRYLFWRTTSTLTYYDPLSYAFAIILFLAELYGILIFFMGLFVNLQPYRRPVAPLPDNQEKWPSVDVLVPSYNEEPAVLETTIIAALQINYPKDKLKVYLCDDGGTDQRCNWPDPEPGEPDYHKKLARAQSIREGSIKRRATLQALCLELGCNYITRPRNEHSKAGNLNYALHNHTKGELILILDADHVPTNDILLNTVGWMVRDPKMFLVQTPHFFLNADPIEKNLGTFGYMPSENEMFYRQIQMGLDFWNASFFCGSAAILRRTALMEVGGISGETITEDAETALNLHSRGWHSAYIQRPMVSGLSPEEFTDFMGQRQRWAQGMASIFVLSNPLLKNGLSLAQRICYLNSCMFWFFPFARLTFLLAPLPFLMFGLKIYDTNALTFLAYGLPHIVAVLIASDYLYGKLRWTFISEIYELLQSFYTMPAVMTGLFKPKGAAFKVTAKGKQLDEDYLAPVTHWFYLVGGAVMLSILYGIFKLAEQMHYIYTEKMVNRTFAEITQSLLTSEGDFYATVITLGWAMLNMLLLLASLGAVVERKQRRVAHRLPVDEGAVLHAEGHEMPARIVDIATGGLRLQLKESAAQFFKVGDKIVVRPEDYPGQIGLQLNMIVRRVSESRGGLIDVGASFDPGSLKERFAKVAFVHCRSQRYVDFQHNRSKRRPGILYGLAHLTRLGMYNLPRFFYFFIRSVHETFGDLRRRIFRSSVPKRQAS
jgi:cellulose synthase (UDP-forming)